ncbi:MAG: hypothetical protein OXI88_13845 [Gammaproteobacteria bacterium]|nr:hypothetical protein [Gammaproteobacteria bacterium]
MIILSRSISPYQIAGYLLEGHGGAFSIVEPVIVSSFVNISTDWLAEHGTTIDSYSFHTYIHEIGHALGLGHPGPYNDIGNAARNHLQGRAGNDELRGGPGADRLDGGAGADRVPYIDSDTGVEVSLEDSTGAGGHAEGDVIADIENVIGSDYDDALIGNERPNELYAGDGDDVLIGGAGADFLQGGKGIDLVDYTDSDTGVRVNLTTNTGEGGHAMGDVIADVENVIGSLYRDILWGDGNANRLFGGGGNDELHGDDGDDLLEGGAGADNMSGGAGMDTVSYRESDEAVTVNLEESTVHGGHAEGDQITGFENVIGSAHADVLLGNDGDNLFEGGAGADRLEGGEGADTFIFDRGHGEDTIADFTDGEDLIDLTAFGLSGFEELTSLSDSDGTTIDLTAHPDGGGGSILLEGFDMANLDATDFTFT